MPPQLALLLCTGFVLALLRIDYRQSRGLSSALWIPTLWVLYSASRPLSGWFLTGGVDAEEGSGIDRLFLVGLILAAVIVLVRRGFDWAGALSRNGWLMVLLGFALVSVGWSEYPFVAFKRWVRIVGCVPMALVMLSEPSPLRAVEAILRRSIYILIPFSFLLIKYYPALGVEFGTWSGARSWVGVASQKNGLGRLCLISAFALIWTMVRQKTGSTMPPSRQERLVQWLMLAMILFLLKGPPGGYSATSLISLGFGLLTLWSLYWMRRNRNTQLIGVLRVCLIAIFLLGIVLPFVGTSAVSTFASKVGRDATLTGRTEIWGELVPLAWQRPLLGKGCGSFWIDAPISHYVNEAHNGFLEVMLTLGGIGLVLLAIFLLSFFEAARRALTTRFDAATLGICFVLMATLHNVSESSFVRGTTHIWTMTVILAMLCNRRLARVRRTKARQSDYTHVSKGDSLEQPVAAS